MKTPEHNKSYRPPLAGRKEEAKKNKYDSVMAAERKRNARFVQVYIARLNNTFWMSPVTSNNNRLESVLTANAMRAACSHVSIAITVYTDDAFRREQPNFKNVVLNFYRDEFVSMILYSIFHTHI